MDVRSMSDEGLVEHWRELNMKARDYQLASQDIVSMYGGWLQMAEAELRRRSIPIPDELPLYTTRFNPLQF